MGINNSICLYYVLFKELSSVILECWCDIHWHDIHINKGRKSSQPEGSTSFTAQSFSRMAGLLCREGLAGGTLCLVLVLGNPEGVTFFKYLVVTWREGV